MGIVNQFQIDFLRLFNSAKLRISLSDQVACLDILWIALNYDAKRLKRTRIVCLFNQFSADCQISVGRSNVPSPLCNHQLSAFIINYRNYTDRRNEDQQADDDKCGKKQTFIRFGMNRRLDHRGLSVDLSAKMIRRMPNPPDVLLALFFLPAKSGR